MSIRVLTIVGARPQFIKAAAISAAIVEHNQHNECLIEEFIIHTGQHYDQNMSDVFYEQLHIPKPVDNLNLGDLSHGEMTGRMIISIEEKIQEYEPDYLLLYGDTNSTLAGAVAGSKMNVRIVHVEAGLRSYNRKMPEESNRVLTDHASHLLFCPTRSAVEILKGEGITKDVYHVGDVMYDAAINFKETAKKHSSILKTLKLERDGFYLATIHRPENTNDKNKLLSIFTALTELSSQQPVALSLHPGTRTKIEEFGIKTDKIKVIEPLSYFDMIVLESSASVIITDSGGIQKEAYFHKVPCVTMRDETEWIETVEAEWNQLVGSNSEAIIQAVKTAIPNNNEIDDYGKGDAAEKIVAIISANYADTGN